MIMRWGRLKGRAPSNRRRPCIATTTPTCPAFERTSKRRKGFPSETRVKRGLRFVRGGEKELVEKLGRNDPCPCGSDLRFQALLSALGPVSTVPNAITIGGEK